MKHRSDPADSAGQTLLAGRGGPPESIEKVLEQGLELLPRLREAGDPSATAELLYRMSNGFAELGLHLEAFVHASEAVDAAQGHGAELLLCRAACALGSAQRELGLHDESNRTLVDTLRLARALDATDQVRDVLLGLSQLATRSAEALRHGGDAKGAQAATTKAGDYAEQALQLIRQPGQPPTPGAVLCLLGACLTTGGHIEAARAALGDAHSHAIRHGDALLKLRADAGLAEALWAEQAYAAALPLANQLLQSAMVLRDDDVRLRAQQLLYKAHKALGDLPHALEHLEQSQLLQQARAESLRALQARWTQRRIAQDKIRANVPRRVPAHAKDPWSATSMLATLDGGRPGSELAAIQDPITGLGNRRHVERELPRLLALSERRKSTLSIALVEVDHLRTINERFGRSVRDAVLKVMAELMQTHTRTADLIGRTGPDEFVLVLCDATREGAREACERLRIAVQDHAWDSIAASLGITASVGLCEQGGKLNAAQLLARADRALYFARRKGGNRIVMADETL
jgi:diguanylate cyclase (GGDEF)-like protein